MSYFSSNSSIVKGIESLCDNDDSNLFILGHTSECARTSSYDKRLPQTHSYILRSINSSHLEHKETNRILTIGDANVNID